MGISAFTLDSVQRFRSVLIYSFPMQMPASALAKEMKHILETESLLKQPYRKVHIFWAFPESILVPPEMIDRDANNKMLDLVYGDEGDKAVKIDFLYRHNLHNVYRVPSVIHDSFLAQFPAGIQTHQYSVLVDRKTVEGDELLAVFYTSSLTVMLRREGKLQVLQNFSYSNPADAAYQLLNICKSFDITPETVKLQVTGLVDERSNLYAAIYNYFLNVEFDNLSPDFGYSDEIKDHPQHFFSHLFTLASCV